MRLSIVRAVLDTNVLLDLWLFDEPSVRPLRAAIEAGHLLPLGSDACDAEFADVLARERFGLDAAARAGLQRQWAACRRPIDVVSAAPFACSDGADQKFLDLAFSAGADLLLTRDKALLRLARRAAAGGLRIARPDAPLSVGPALQPAEDP